MYKKHWKTPYRESTYNIQKKDRMITDEENVELYTSGIPEFDPNNVYDQLIMREQMPNATGKKLMFDQEGKTEEEKSAELWKAFEEQP
jgi:hypothetical protein